MGNLPEIFLNAYRHGIFPMAEKADESDFFWVDPPLRGQLPILDLHIPKKLERAVRQSPYRVTVDTAFADVLHLCAEEAENRRDTWINAPIKETFIALHEQGFAHSIECWQEDKLVGGLYGLAIGGVFCGESMVSRARDASKIALVHLGARLYQAGFAVLDTQFVNYHLKQFGVYEIPRADYLALLLQHRDRVCDFSCAGLSEQQLIENYFSARKK